VVRGYETNPGSLLLAARKQGHPYTGTRLCAFTDQQNHGEISVSCSLLSHVTGQPHRPSSHWLWRPRSFVWENSLTSLFSVHGICCRRVLKYASNRAFVRKILTPFCRYHFCLESHRERLSASRIGDRKESMPSRVLNSYLFVGRSVFFHRLSIVLTQY
jgi:hypothetical protein